MEIAIAILGLGLGACIGLMAGDMRQRFDVMKEIEASETESKALVAGIRDTHNNLVIQIKALSDRLGAVEFSVRSASVSSTRQVFK
ncbi:MAG: hypothetical protein MUP44_09960 [Anaerolineales bacterium]|nr:hypothetical protein [Anaerolineales bacterium]